MKKVIMKFDGACSNNKRDGDTGIGAHAYYEGEEEGSLFKLAMSTGIGNSNETEYKAIIYGMMELKKRGLTNNVTIMGDSKTVIGHLTGKYELRSNNLIPYYRKAKQLLSEFNNVDLVHIKREFNELADELSRKEQRRTLVDYYNYKF